MKTPRLASILFLMLALTARANLTVILDAAPRVVEQGSVLVFSGTLTNTSATGKLFLNDVQAAFAAPSAAYLSLETNAFFANVPGILAPGESYTGILFQIAVSSLAPPDAYSGSVSFHGGADIFATANLASANPSIASPAVDIVASDPIACEFGADHGAFTIARTGSRALALNMPIAISGTAINGVTYQTVASSIAIPAGSATASIAIVPVPDTIAQGDRTAIVTLGTFAATVVIRDKPIDEWRFDKFATPNAPAAADLADPEGDGARNLAEYALNLEPLSPDGFAQPPVTIAGGFLTLSYVPKSWATDLVYVVEASTDLVNWSAVDVENVDVENREPPDRITMRWKNPVATSSPAWLRLSITRAP